MIYIYIKDARARGRAPGARGARAAQLWGWRGRALARVCAVNHITPRGVEWRGARQRRLQERAKTRDRRSKANPARRPHQRSRRAGSSVARVVAGAPRCRPSQGRPAARAAPFALAAVGAKDRRLLVRLTVLLLGLRPSCRQGHDCALNARGSGSPNSPRAV